MKKFKVIIDTDPGVDDTTGLVYAMHDPQFDIKLITISNGNINIDNATRNMCHLLDLFHKDIPVVKGYRKRLGDSKEDAIFLHTKEGLGGYIPPKTTTHQPLDVDAADAVYEVLKANPKEITMIILGTHTNFANLLIKHPDAKDLVKQIVMEGGAPFGTKSDPNHNSFNIRTDAPAFKHTIDSKIPTTMVPSSIGRDCGHFTEEMVEEIKNMNDVGKFLNLTYQTYWEPNYPDRRIANNDICAINLLTHPHLYKTKRANIELDVETGKTTAIFTRKGTFKIAYGLRRKKFIKLLFKKLHEMDDIKIPELAKQDELRKEAEMEKERKELSAKVTAHKTKSKTKAETKTSETSKAKRTTKTASAKTSTKKENGTTTKTTAKQKAQSPAKKKTQTKNKKTEE